MEIVQRGAAIRQRLGEPRHDHQRRVVTCNRFIVSLEALQRDPAVVECNNVMRVDLQSAFSARQRLFMAPKRVLDVGLICLRVGCVRIDRQRALQERLCARKISPLRGNYPQCMKRIEVVRRVGKNVAIDALSLL